MKRFRMKPSELFHTLLAWNALEGAERRILLSLDDSKPLKGPALRRLTEAGFLVEAEDGSLQCPFEGIRRDFVFLSGLNSPQPSKKAAYARYAESVYSETERDRLLGVSSSWSSGEAFLNEVCTFRYYQRFFREPGDLARKRLLSGGPVSGTSFPPEAFEYAKQILAFILTSSRLLEAKTLLRAFPPNGNRLFPEALAACLKLALVVLRCDAEDLKIRAGLWPELLLDGSVWTKGVSLVPSTAGTKEFAPYVLGDMEAFLVQAAYSELRIRSNGRSLYRKDSLRAEAFLRDLPAGSDGGLNSIDPPRNRLERCLSLLLALRLLSVGASGGRGRALEVSPEGLFWLSRNRKKKFLHIAHRLRTHLGVKETKALLFETLLALLGGGNVYDLKDLIDYAVYRWNPFLGSKELPYSEALERWKAAVEGCLFSYLLPLGGLSLGFSSGRTAAALSSTGKFLLGDKGLPSLNEEKEPVLEIFPDFRLRVEDSSPWIAGKIAVFADALSLPGWYGITKTSIGRAAAEGIPFKVIGYVLGDLSKGELPRGVEEGLRRLYDEADEAVLLPGSLVECRDRASAEKFLGLGLSPAPRRITDKIFLIDPSIARDALARSCELEGIVFKAPRNPGSRNNPGRFPPS